jgi:hypothetical protein
MQSVLQLGRCYLQRKWKVCNLLPDSTETISICNEIAAEDIDKKYIDMLSFGVVSSVCHLNASNK